MSPVRTAATSGFKMYTSELEAVKNILFVASDLNTSLKIILLPIEYFDFHEECWDPSRSSDRDASAGKKQVSMRPLDQAGNPIGNICY
jgi:hypothetical protein